MTTFDRHINAITLTCILVFLLSIAGCAGITVTTLPDGQVSQMSAESNLARSHLNIAHVPLSAELAYRDTKTCDYDETYNPYNKLTIYNERLHISIKSIKFMKRRYRVVIKGKNDTSTLLIGQNGKLYDFNAIDEKGHRVTPENYDSSKKIKSSQNSQKINLFTILFPQFTKKSLRPGDIASVIRDNDDKNWAVYKYRGLTHIQGTTSAVFDLKTVPFYGDYLIGYDVIDLKTMMPVIVVQDAGDLVRLSRISCSGYYYWPKTDSNGYYFLRHL